MPFASPTPRALILSVTRSDALARSRLVASERRRIGISPSVLFFTSQPARAIYPRASAASVAVFVVAAPAALAAASIWAYSSLLARAVTADASIAFSKSL